MIEPASRRVSSIELPGQDALIREPGGWHLEGIIAAAPFAVAALWAAATGASVLFWAVSGSLRPLDWCRSGGVLVGVAVLILLTSTASLVNTTWRRARWSSRRRHSALSRPTAPPPVSGWRFEEGRFTSV
jgi:hypothetical protein